jgi:hypothetical protein
MRLPIVCLDQRLRHYLTLFAGCFSQPQYKYFVTILLGLMLCQSGRTLSGLLRQVNNNITEDRPLSSDNLWGYIPAFRVTEYSGQQL